MWHRGMWRARNTPITVLGIDVIMSGRGGGQARGQERARGRDDTVSA